MDCALPGSEGNAVRGGARGSHSSSSASSRAQGHRHKGKGALSLGAAKAGRSQGPGLADVGMGTQRGRFRGPRRDPYYCSHAPVMWMPSAVAR